METSLVNAATAAQRAYHRQMAMEDLAATPFGRNGTQLPPPPQMRLTELLPLISLPRMEAARARPAPEGRMLTNADLIATIDQVLDIVGNVGDYGVEDAMNQTMSS
jgi:hypothetical protein